MQPDLFIDGKLTLGENIADIGGLRLAGRAYADWVAENGVEEEVAGFTGEQLVFVAYAQAWCSLATPEIERQLVRTNPHSPPRYRVNGVVTNLPEFGRAFGCKKKTPMRPKKVCDIW